MQKEIKMKKPGSAKCASRFWFVRKGDYVVERIIGLEEMYIIWLACVGLAIRSSKMVMIRLPNAVLFTWKEVSGGEIYLASEILSKPTTFTSLGTWIFLLLKVLSKWIAILPLTTMRSYVILLLTISCVFRRRAYH